MKGRFFCLPGFKNVHTLLIFYLKLLTGAGLWYIYSRISPNRFTSDIFKYYDDAALMYSTVHRSYADFIRMITGINDTSPAIRSIYVQMNSWANGYDSALYNNSHFIIRLNAVFMFFSQGHYAVHLILFCLISLTGLILIYKRFYPYLTGRRILLFAAIFLFPSVLLWGSGILKESLVFLGLGMALYYSGRWLHRQGNSVKNIILFLLALILLFENKAYVLLCILPCLLAEFALNKFPGWRKRPAITYFLVTAIYLLAGLNINRLGCRISPLAMLVAKQTDFNRIANGGLYIQKKGDSTAYSLLPATDRLQLIPGNAFCDSVRHLHGIEFISAPAFTSKEIASRRFAFFTLKPGTKLKQFHVHETDTAYSTASDSALYWVFVYGAPAKSRIHIKPIKPSIAGLAARIPQSLAISLLRPYPEELHSPTAILDFAENIMLWVLILFTLIAPYFKTRQAQNNTNVPISLPAGSAGAFCLTYSLLMFILIGLVTPLYGGIERYRSLAIPFLLILLIILYDKRTRT